jgi:hypothetical protein
VIENFLGRIVGLARCPSLTGKGNVVVGEPVYHLGEIPALGFRISTLFGRFGDELGPLIQIRLRAEAAKT